MKVTISKPPTTSKPLSLLGYLKEVLPTTNMRATREIKNNPSPKRFIIRVKMPEVILD
jgi:hypothetical protein